MLYPAIEPYASGLLDVGHGHRVYWEQCGNPQGQPIVFLHGGPGGGCTALSRRFFDPRRYRVVLFDQRGCGRSIPHARTEHNFCEDLVRDMETLREALGIERWQLFGGSWGTTLALAYTRHHQERVQGLVLRGVFGAQPHELDWLYKPGGASQIFPQAWHAFVTALGPLGSIDQQQLLMAYDQCLQGDDKAKAQAAAQAWCAWESAVSSIHTAPQSSAAQRAAAPDPHHSLAMARISANMLLRDPWLGVSGHVWPAQGLHGIPGTIVQGQWDVVTPLATAWQLHQSWPGSTLCIVPEAGHASSDPALRLALIQALDDFPTSVIPAQAGIQDVSPVQSKRGLDSRLRGNDKGGGNDGHCKISTTS